MSARDSVLRDRLTKREFHVRLRVDSTRSQSWLAISSGGQRQCHGQQSAAALLPIVGMLVKKCQRNQVADRVVRRPMFAAMENVRGKAAANASLCAKKPPQMQAYALRRCKLMRYVTVQAPAIATLTMQAYARADSYEKNCEEGGQETSKEGGEEICEEGRKKTCKKGREKACKENSQNRKAR